MDTPSGSPPKLDRVARARAKAARLALTPDERRLLALEKTIQHAVEAAERAHQVAIQVREHADTLTVRANRLRAEYQALQARVQQSHVQQPSPPSAS